MRTRTRERPLAAPTHRPTLYEPGGQVTVFVEKPTGRARGFKGHCKYCYRTHKSWWDMANTITGDPEDAIVLCGYCEHTSLRVLAATIGPDL